MRGADASAGTIKSGGATRRAAKMVILDVDHPDIEEFIETKAREEDKIRALRDAGFDMDLGGKDIVSVQYQNANNSVRVSDEFMRAVESGGDVRAARPGWTGEVIETVDARELFRKIAAGGVGVRRPGHAVRRHDQRLAHQPGDRPDHRQSNPCSEYMHLDNSSCNLASLNLMKFLATTTARSRSRSSSRSVEFVITAMDISICFADFPTEKIGETTRAYRQLGIGYANLGALLMASGLPYDSDGGRPLAGADHLADDRHRLPPLRRAGRGGRPVRRVRPQRRGRTSGSCASTPRPTTRSRPTGAIATAIAREATRQWQQCLKIGEKNG